MNPKLFLLSATLLCVLPSVAKRGVTVIPAGGGENVQVPFADIGDIRFSGADMKITSPAGEVTNIPIASIDQMRFDMELLPTSVGETVLDDISILADHGIIRITSAAPIDIAVFSMQGSCIFRASGTAEETVDLTEVPAGVYIIKANKKTIKYIR